MSKPEPEAAVEEPSTAADQPKGPSGAVADLEKRLAMLSNDPPPPMEVAEQQQPTSFAMAPPAAAAAPASGKNALLARIKAAQERAKQAKPKVEELPPPDIFDMAPPVAATASAPPPPAFEDFITPPPQEEAPPAFSLLEDTFDMKPPPSAQASAPPSYAAAPPAPSAPAFEDLLYGTAPNAPSAMGGMEQMPPPPMPVDMQQTQQSDNQQAFAEEFAGLEGLSEEEKHSMMEEQRRIMEEIEKNKSTKVASAADAFDQRSNAAVARIAGGEPARARNPGSSSSKSKPSDPQRTVKVGENQEVALHGQERTRAAIEDGTAILTQCVNCSNWMQVTDNATLMFCPVCQVVSPVDRENAVTTKEEALQMEADRKMAEELQNEEYSTAERAERRQRRAQQQQQATAAKQDDSWWGWLGMGGAPAPAPGTQTQQAAQYRGDMGASRPPGAGATLAPAQTGEGGSNWASGGGSYDDEDRRLLGGGARVAEAKPLFACVADSITTAASSLSTAINTTTDTEGNVNGVDGSSLLVISQAGRNQPGN